MKLYEIAQEYRQALDSLVNEETGELDEQAIACLNGITVSLEEKGLRSPATSAILKQTAKHSRTSASDWLRDRKHSRRVSTG